MDHIASLLRRAADVRQRVFASLPWGYRLATLFLAMDASSIEAWGRQMGALMLQAGVTGLPDPGPRWNPEKPNPKDLPRHYLFEFGKKAYGVALKVVQNPEDAGDAMMDTVMEFLKSPKLKGMKASSAMSFITTQVMWQAKAIRKKRRDQDSIDDPGSDEEGETIDLVDNAFSHNPYWNENPRQFRQLNDTIPEKIWEQDVMPAVAKIHPDMPLYFDLLLKGHSGKEIVEEGMLPNFSPSEYSSPNATWNAKVQKAKGIIRDVVEKAGWTN